jgi:integrase
MWENVDMGKLTALGIKKKSAGRYGDGDGLYLIVGNADSRSWVCRVQKDGKRRDIGLGSAKKVSLQDARQLAGAIRAQVAAGIDPIAERVKSKGIPSFRVAAGLVYEEQRHGWKNQKHNAQWLSSLEAYAFPHIGDMPVSQIEIPAVRDMLLPIWTKKHETARRVQQRVNTIVNWAVAKGYREHGLALEALAKGLPSNVVKVKHHKAMGRDEAPTFYAHLAGKNSTGALALRFIILTAARTGEALGATWAEIDMEAAVWTVPAERMKAKNEHRVPLTLEALAILKEAKARQIGGSDYVFQGTRKGRPLSDMTLTKLMRDAGRDETVHGFRSTFRNWIAETTEYPNEVAELALAHTIKNKAEAAYRREDMLDRRRPMMKQWADFVIKC